MRIFQVNLREEVSEKGIYNEHFIIIAEDVEQALAVSKHLAQEMGMSEGLECIGAKCLAFNIHGISLEAVRWLGEGMPFHR